MKRAAIVLPAALLLGGCPGRVVAPAPAPVPIRTDAVQPAQILPQEGVDRVRALVDLPGDGDLVVSVDAVSPQARFSVRVFPPEGGLPLAEGPAPLSVRDLKAGRYLLEIRSDTPVATRIGYKAAFVPPDPDADSGPDATPEGADPLRLAPASGGLQTATATAEVSYDRRNRTDWYRLEIPDRGHLVLAFRPANPRARVRADFGRTAAEAEAGGGRVGPDTGFDVDKGSVYVRVQALDRGESSAYALEADFRPAVWIEALVVEVNREGGCAVLVDKGSAQQVRTNAAANVLVGGQVVSAGVVEEAFPQLSRVKVFAGDCRLAGATVQIAAGN